jgi:hypothetical protein
MYVLLPNLRFLLAFSSFVRQMPGYKTQRQSAAGTSKTSSIYFIAMDVPTFFIALYVPFSVSCVLLVSKYVL